VNPVFILAACRVLLGLAFLIACSHKILFPGSFAQTLYFYQLLPDRLINPLAITLPWVEAVAAVAIMASARFKDAAALLMIGLLAVFTAAIAINLFRGLDVSCGCFSTGGDDPIGWGNVIRNAGYMFIAFLVLFEERLLNWNKGLRL